MAGKGAERRARRHRAARGDREVTLSLSRRSLDFFKREGKKRRVPYQRMIRALVDRYAEREEGRGRS